MAESGRLNKHYAEQLRQFERAMKPGTPEFIKRHTPSPHLDVRCTTPECLNRSEEGGLESYWLCDLCSSKAPDVITSYTHCPTKMLLPLKKRKAANAAAFSAACLMKKRSRK